jgi:hypothetical protein
MTTEVLARSVTAAVATYFGQGRIWYLKAATGPVTIVCRKSGQGSTTVRSFINVAAGFKFKADLGDGWDILELTSASTQNIEMILGDDDVEVSNAVTVNGSVTTAVAPSSTVTTIADPSIVAAGNNVIAANLSRKRIWIGSLSSNAPADALNLRVAETNAARGFELQPGMYEKFETTAALTIRNASATTAQSYWIFEES